MTPQDFRIGNLLESLTCGGAHQIEGIEIVEGGFNIKVKGYTHEYRDGEYFEFETIQLTQEWLERFGFSDEDYTFEKDGIAIEWAIRRVSTNERSGFRFSVKTMIRDIDISVQHVHQLQNLYYALTGKELTYDTNTA